jgi:signal transduction histidine kinase
VKRAADLSLRTRVLLAISGCSLFGLVLISALFLAVERANVREQKQRAIDLAAHVIAERSNAAIVFGDAALVEHTLRSLALDPSIELACVYLADGARLGEWVRDAGTACPGAMPAPSRGFGPDRYEVTESIALDGEEIGRLYLRSDLAALRAQLERMLVIGLACAAAVGGLLVLVSATLGRALTAPIVALRDAANSIAQEPGGGQRVARAAGAEIGELVDAFNHMVQTIEERDRALQENRETLEQLVEERTRELSNINKELESFSYSVSHDLRAPLRSIDGFSMAVIEDAGARLTPEHIGYLRRIRAAAQTMGRLIDSMLGLARVSRKPVTIEAVDLAALAHDVMQDLLGAYPGRHIEARIGTGLTAYGDRDLLRIVLLNLLGNACKYTGNVERALVEFDRCRHNGHDAFFVRDNGAGFDMQYADRLFGAFQRLHGADEFEGTGIGLATVYRIVARHHGEIWAEGAPGRGATFYLTLPLRPPS